MPSLQESARIWNAEMRKRREESRRNYDKIEIFGRRLREELRRIQESPEIRSDPVGRQMKEQAEKNISIHDRYVKNIDRLSN